MPNSAYTPQLVLLRDRAYVTELVRTRHWMGLESLRAIERSLGLGKTVLQTWCKRHTIPVRTQNEATALAGRDPAVIAKRSGPLNGRFGKRDPASAARMRANNPIHMPGVHTRMLTSMAKTLTRKRTPTEIYFGALLPAAVPQFVAARCIIDLAFVPEKIAVELDGKGHRSAFAVYEKDMRRDARLIAESWRVIRVNNCAARRPAHLIYVLHQLIPDLQVASSLPDEPRIGGNQYDVILRDAESLSGKIVQRPNPLPRYSLEHGSNPSPAPTMGEHFAADGHVRGSE